MVIKLGCHCELCHALRLNGVLKGMCTQVNAYIGLDTLLLSVILSFADGDNLSQFLPRKKALHDSSKMNLQHRSYRCVKMNQHVSNYEMLKLNFIVQIVNKLFGFYQS